MGLWGLGMGSPMALGRSVGSKRHRKRSPVVLGASIGLKGHGMVSTLDLGVSGAWDEVPNGHGGYPWAGLSLGLGCRVYPGA